MDHDIIGPAIRHAIELGRQEAYREKLHRILQRQIGKRFGTLPEWAEQQLSPMSAEQMEELTVRVLGASSLDELLEMESSPISDDHAGCAP